MTINDKLLKLSQVQEAKDIKSLSHGIFPGCHCPLFGLAMIASFIDDLVVLVAGTQECSYYVKDFAYQRQQGQDNFYSLVTDKHDITFGCEDKIKEAIEYIDRRHRPKAIMIVSTCVLELIGEDFPALAQSMEDRVQAKLLVVTSEHFKSTSHIVGMEDALRELVKLMEPLEREEKTVNILGPRQAGVENTELYKLLELEGIKVTTIIPSRISIDELAQAPSASLNIVTDFIALPLARAMEEKFDLPYVYMEKYLDKTRIKSAYLELESALNIELTSHLKSKEEELDRLIVQARELLAGKSFIYGNTPLIGLEFSSFLTSLSMEPILIQLRDFYENDPIFKEEILKSSDPYISQMANIAAMDPVYRKLRPDFYIGHENPMKLAQLNITQLTLDETTSRLGYETPIMVLKKLLAAHRDMEVSRLKMMRMLDQGGIRDGVM